MVDMRFAMEESRYQAMGTVKNHDAVLYVRVTRAASEDDIDDLLDADSVVIEEALEGEELGGVVKAVTHNATEFTDSADGNMVLAEMTLTFNVLYRADIGDVQTPRS